MLKISNSNNNVGIEYDATDNDKNLVVNNNFHKTNLSHCCIL